MADRLIDNYLNVQQAAEQLGVSPQVLRRLVRKGELSFRRMGGRYIFKIDDLKAYLDGLEPTLYPERNRGPQVQLKHIQL